MVDAILNPAVNPAANPARGEASLSVFGHVLNFRPTFDALVKAEQEVGSLFAFVERAAAGQLQLGELASLFWHTLAEGPAGFSRAQLGEAIVEVGLAAATPVLKALVQQILQGR